MPDPVTPSPYEKRQAAQAEFEKIRAAKVRALLATRPAMTAIDLVEKLLQENPSLPVCLKIGSLRPRDLPLVALHTDDVKLYLEF